MTVAAHDIRQAESRQLADALDRIRQALGILHELAAIDEPRLVRGHALNRLLRVQLCRLLVEAAPEATTDGTAAAEWVLRIEGEIATEQARLSAELDA